MYKTLQFVLTCSLVAFLIVSCGPSQSQYDALVKENRSLKSEISKLKTALDACKAEIEQYQTTPDILYSEAKKCIEKKDIEGLNVICGKFDKYHPTAPEAQKAKAELVKLIRERERIAAAEKAKRMQAVNKLKKEHDDINGTTWYSNPYFKHYNNSNHVSLYMGKGKTGKPWLRLKMSYYGDSWIFFDHAYLSYDGNTMEIPFNEYNDKKSDNDTECWEWIDVAVSDIILNYLRKMVNGKSVKMRLSGKYSKTRDIPKKEIDGLRDVMLAYDVLLHGE